MHPSVHSSTVYNSRDVKGTYLNVHQQMNGKEDVEYIYIHTYIYIHIFIYIYYSVTKKNEIMPFAVTWIDLELIILSEGRQTKTNIIYYLYMRS